MRNNFLKYIINIIGKIKSIIFYIKSRLYADKTSSLSSKNCKFNTLNISGDHDFHDLDPFIEVMILVNFKPSVQGTELSYHLEDFKNIGSNFIRIIFEDSVGKRSEVLHDNNNYVSASVFVTLANRSGPIDSEQWHKIVSISRKLANDFNAMIIVPDKQIVIDKAKNLDILCASLDAQIKFGILTDSFFSKEELTEIICNFDFYKSNDKYILKSDRIRIYLSDDALYSNGKNNDCCRLSIVMDVPCSIQDENILDIFFDLSNKIAIKLNAKLIDINGFILNHDSKELISNQLKRIFKRLDDCGFKSGSYRSKRVFK
ncbi:hypothetical protein CONE_0735 [Candidatus Kinetoplastibacterium oncopeltii TCC290E]|uniref:Cell division protein ZipA n=1 Tax=Candidatus Kinetoplastidibacterium stringomonadis TCC290E TaxID=1208920 RepID=M1LSE4_9PROT|nr:hypothetical protein [Candidatus Kinetoplastibacterium oncopeltii]AGF48472.1 hypothetical protein CONE_0735 [Candidatus Kinetoplastibacterium oncopeltii TCC290E]